MEAPPKPATTGHHGQAGRTLVVYGSFGRRQLEKAVSDWSRVVVLEVDAYLPEPLRNQCAAVMTIPPLLPEREAEMLQARAEDLLDRFLEDRVSVPGLVTDRRFRAACMSIEAWRIVVPHVVCLEYARRVMALGPWDSILMAPGVGVSARAFEQLGQALGVPVRSLSFDREHPPLGWMLRRKWQRSRTRHRVPQAAATSVRLPAVDQPGGFWCADPRLEAMLARSDTGARWVRGPSFVEPDAEELNIIRAEYEKWWDAWWQDWQSSQPQDDPMADHLILEDLGKWLSRERYPRHALLLRQAQEAVQRWKPERVLTGSMRGRQEFLWGLAAQDQGIPAAVYTIDCHIDPRLCFKPDVVLCDDMRQWDIATQSAGIRAEQVIRVRSHRQPPMRAAGAPVFSQRQRKRLLLADTYYSGMVASSQPLLSLWAYRRIIEAARALPEHDFVIKYHPVRERPEAAFHHSGLHHLHLWLRDEFIKGLKPPPNLTLLPPEVRLSEELEEADILLNIQSYAGLEAFALHIPVIYLQPWDEEGLYPRMNEMGVMQVAVDTQRLVELIRLNLTDADHVRRQLAVQAGYLDYFYWKDGPTLVEAAAGQR